MLNMNSLFYSFKELYFSVTFYLNKNIRVLKIFLTLYCRAVDPHSHYADPDPAVFLNADPDPGPGIA